ncbi:MAG: DUF86 domain-containing protein [Phycisphaerae bacterium]
MERDAATLVDIVLACRDIGSFVQGVEASAFKNDTLIRSAVIRQLEIIGEATKRLPDAFRDAHPDISWKRMAGLRDRPIHAYDDIDISKIWQVATLDGPEVRAALEPLIAQDD